MADEEPKSGELSESSIDLPFSPGQMVPGRETMVAMDLAGIKSVERRQMLTKIIVIVLAVVAVISLAFALWPRGDESSVDTPAARSE